ncbi:MAG: hypothetical protein AAF658_11520, partial [Myxococcota bacterium]
LASPTSASASAAIASQFKVRKKFVLSLEVGASVALEAVMKPTKNTGEVHFSQRTEHTREVQ